MESRINNKIREEPDWNFLNMAWDLEEKWMEDLRAILPKNELEWLKLFPEAKSIIPIKIMDWKEKAEVAQSLIKQKLDLINTKVKEEDRWFWREIIKYLFPPVEHFAIAKKHIKRLSWLIQKKNIRTDKNWASAVEIARQQSIIHIAERYGLKLKKSGQTYKSLCPKHNERTPSFCLYPSKNRFVCFGCDIKGDGIALVQALENCSFKEAIQKLQTI